jgi:SWI/SNF-related matrix-associated actin-dependent regulator 1 of chromatin subfamily A
MVPEGKVLRPFQRKGVEFLSTRTRCLLADDPGLGKTIQAIAAINILRAQKILIICPAGIKYNWYYELRAWLTDPRLVIQVVANSSTIISELADIVIINYDLLTFGLEYGEKKEMKTGPILGQLLSRIWDVGVFDEAHYMKNDKAMRTKVVLHKNKIAAHCKRVWFMTGTPVLNRPIELWPILRAAAPEVIHPYLSKLDFAKQYCAAWWDGLMWHMDGSSHEEELNEALHAGFLLRRRKEHVLKELPPKQYKVVPFAPTETMYGYLKQEQQILEDIETNPVKLNLGGMPIAMHRRELAEAKVGQCVSYIMDELEGVEKIVVWAHHRSVIAKLQHDLQAYNPVVITGDTPSLKRAEAVEDFQTDPTVRLFIGQITAAGTGITLTAASNVIFIEITWTPGELIQCVDRCHRFGQKNSVLATFLVTQGSLEEFMLRRVVEKLTTINRIVEKDDNSETS